MRLLPRSGLVDDWRLVSSDRRRLPSSPPTYCYWSAPNARRSPVHEPQRKLPQSVVDSTRQDRPRSRPAPRSALSMPATCPQILCDGRPTEAYPEEYQQSGGWKLPTASSSARRSTTTVRRPRASTCCPSAAPGLNGSCRRRGRRAPAAREPPGDRIVDVVTGVRVRRAALSEDHPGLRRRA